MVNYYYSIVRSTLTECPTLVSLCKNKLSLVNDKCFNLYTNPNVNEDRMVTNEFGNLSYISLKCYDIKFYQLKHTGTMYSASLFKLVEFYMLAFLRVRTPIDWISPILCKYCSKYGHLSYPRK